MTRVIISGISGRLGTTLSSVIKDEPAYNNYDLVAGFDQTDGNVGGVPVFSIPEQVHQEIPEADVIIDFSNYAFVPEVLRYAVKAKVPVVIATTALGEQEYELMRKAAEIIPVFHSANMSLGVNLVAKMSQLAAPVIEEGFNIEIVETHHNKKKDAPSGTAILLADAINEVLESRKDYVFGRHGREEAPSLSELGIHAVRGGSVPGRHTVMFAGPDEVIEITHTVYSTKVFALGAMKAAGFVAGKPPGLYNMNSLIG
jgi:4-hydroxy-tetrahydrodipicolinate reductase